MYSTNALEEFKLENNNKWIEDWILARAESKETIKHYTWGISKLEEFCKKRDLNFDSVVEDYRKSRYQGAREEQEFLDKWNDTISVFSSSLKKTFPSLSRKAILTAAKSFFKKWKIPLDVELPKRVFVTYQNKDLTKEVIRQILSKATQRNRTIFLILAESGLRAGNVAGLKYWQIKKDFENNIVPMQILTPSAMLKYHVGDRWSFIGKDGFTLLKQYLTPRMLIKNNENVFLSEKLGCTNTTKCGVSSISGNFKKLTKALKYERGSPFGKPGLYRLHGLRKYFRNNMRVDPSYREFWMGHSLGVDAHYISRDLEEHRTRYAKAYDELRILETQPVNKEELENLKIQNKFLFNEIKDLKQESLAFREIVKKIKEDPKKMNEFAKLFS